MSDENTPLPRQLPSGDAGRQIEILALPDTEALQHLAFDIQSHLLTPGEPIPHEREIGEDTTTQLLVGQILQCAQYMTSDEDVISINLSGDIPVQLIENGHNAMDEDFLLDSDELAESDGLFDVEHTLGFDENEIPSAVVTLTNKDSHIKAVDGWTPAIKISGPIAYREALPQPSFHIHYDRDKEVHILPRRIEFMRIRTITPQE